MKENETLFKKWPRLDTRTVTATALTIIWSLIGTMSFLAAIDDSPIRPSRNEKLAWMSVMPEGWGFFTKSPREPEIIAYEWTGNNWHQITYSATARENRWGFTRNSRVQGVEIGALYGAVPPDAWIEDVDPFSDTFEMDQLPLMRVGNMSVRPSARGMILLESRPPIPWAWSSSAESVRMPGRFARLLVNCEGPEA